LILHELPWFLLFLNNHYKVIEAERKSLLAPVKKKRHRPVNEKWLI